MEKIADALALLSLTVFATQSVVATLGFTFIGRIRDLVRNQKDTILLQFERDLRNVQDEIKGNRALDGRTLARHAKGLRKKEKRLRASITRFDAALRCLDIRHTLVLPVGMLFLVFCEATLAKVLPPHFDLGFLCASFVTLCVAIMLILSQLRNLQFLSELMTPYVSCSVSCPASWKQGEQHKIIVSAVLTFGRSLHSLHIFLYLHPAFTSTAAFLDKLKRGADDSVMPSYNAISSQTWQSFQLDVPFVYDFDRLACRTPGQYTLFYRVTTEEWTGPFERINITVT